ncbi:MAG: dTDP-4-dehydrorhamnose reductase [Desulfovibrio sp.]|nr:dTDP-4-dehydrorhamnose reductase [Desulfovibrio sp.]
MRILITGGKGMLARTLARELEGQHDVAALGHGEIDVVDAMSVARAFAEVRPDAVLHCAAMTQVDKCESEEGLAYAVNEQGSANIAHASREAGARLVAFSTDYVFDGALDRPYSEFDKAGDALNIYGRSKWAGECAVRLGCPNHIVARVSWLYGPGGPSFVHTMMRLADGTRPLLKVVDDQLGNPTSTLAVARAVKALLERPDLRGTFHLTCEGEATWFDLATAVFALAGKDQQVQACTSAEYPLPARRPANSRLEKRMLALSGMPPMPHWRDALAEFMALEFGCGKA